MDDGDPARSEIIAIRYGTRVEAKSRLFHRFEVYAEPDEPLRMDYYFWVVRDADRTVLVDTGFDRAVGIRRGRTSLHEPGAALSRVGVCARDVSHIVLTHLHYDHVGNLDLFPAATFLIARREMEFWTGPYARRAQFASLVEPDEIERLRLLARHDRLVLLDDEATILPGIRSTCVGGHTPGQLIVHVDTPGGSVVLASDALHYYEELDRDRPFAAFTDLPACYRAYDRLRELARCRGTVIVAGHDPAVMTRFEPLPGGNADLGVLVGPHHRARLAGTRCRPARRDRSPRRPE